MEFGPLVSSFDPLGEGLATVIPALFLLSFLVAVVGAVLTVPRIFRGQPTVSSGIRQAAFVGAAVNILAFVAGVAVAVALLLTTNISTSDLLGFGVILLGPPALGAGCWLWLHRLPVAHRDSITLFDGSL
jgi:hypothetical protein